MLPVAMKIAAGLDGILIFRQIGGAERDEMHLLGDNTLGFDVLGIAVEEIRVVADHAVEGGICANNLADLADVLIEGEDGDEDGGKCQIFDRSGAHRERLCGRSERRRGGRKGALLGRSWSSTLDSLRGKSARGVGCISLAWQIVEWRRLMLTIDARD